MVKDPTGDGMARDEESLKGKLGPAFAAWLLGVRPSQRIRATVVLRAQEPGEVSVRRQSRTERRAAIDTLRKGMEPALAEVDRILERHRGKRLTHEIDALGSVPVETTLAGITALAASEFVKAILEDQPLVRVHGAAP